MLTKKELKEILLESLTTGATFSEIYIEDSVQNLYEMVKDKVTKANVTNVFGVGVRIIKNNEVVYGCTNKIEYNDVLKLAKKLANSFSGNKKIVDFEFEEKNYKTLTPIVKNPKDVKIEDKIKLLKQTNDGCLNTSEEITQVISTLKDKYQKVTIANSNGVFVNDDRCNVILTVNAIAKNETGSQSIHENYGYNQGYEMFDNFDLNAFGKKVATSAVTMLHADEVSGGKMTVVVHNGFGGVLLHEACVHSLEATSVAKGASVFCGKLGQKIASDVVTAIDDGTLINEWGTLTVDDEGHPTQKNVLIEKGVLKSYLVDYRNASIMNHQVTGSGRRQSYKYAPTSRMTNTFFAPGESSFEEIIANTKNGLFAKKMGGGSVDPTTGEFNFAVSEGYLIEDGKITKPVKGATLVGSGAEVLMNIDMIANENLSFGQGMCGSASGSIPTNVGQPTIRVQNVTVGGRG